MQSSNPFSPLPNAVSDLGQASAASYLSPPPPTPKPEESLIPVFEAAMLTPPHDACKFFKSSIAKRGAEMLERISVDATNLDAYQQAKMAFLLMHNQDYILVDHLKLQSPHSANTTGFVRTMATTLMQACTDDSSPHYWKLDAYVQKGGDVSCGENGEFDVSGTFPAFDHPDDPNVVSLFHNSSMDCTIEPVLRLQEASSTICYIVSVVNMIYYSQCIQEGVAESKQNFINVNRFMRNNFTNDEIFRNIFSHHGGWPHDIIPRILGQANPGMKEANTIILENDFEPIEDSSVELVLQVIQMNLEQFGALLIPNFPIFKEFMEEGVLEYSGDWNAKEKFEQPQFHALLLVKARLTGDPNVMGGLALLLQNSWAVKPFVVVGYDLLKSMGITRFAVVNKGLKYEWPADFKDDGEPTKSFMSGSSPSSIDSGVDGRGFNPRSLFATQSGSGMLTDDSDNNLGSAVTRSEESYE